jgi:hypothetical protein
LKPHIITTLEREIEIVQLFEGVQPEDVQDVYLAACPVVYNQVYQTYPGPNIIVYRQFDHFKWLGIDRGMLQIRSSAGNMAFKVAEYLGCNPIILIGQDLALARDGRTNADGAILGSIQDSYLRERRYTVKGNDGQPIETTYSLKIFLESYEVDVAFQQAIDKYIKQPFNPLDRIKGMLSGFTPSDQDREFVAGRINRAIESFGKKAEFCDEAIRIYDENAEAIEGFAEKPDIEQMDKLMEQLSMLQTKCNMYDLETWQGLYAHVAQAYFLNYQIEILQYYARYKDEVRARAEMLRKQREWHEVVGGMLKVYRKVMEKAAEQIN